jgi:hypothetical protein
MKLHYKDVVADYEDEMVHYINVVVQSEKMVLIMRLEKMLHPKKHLTLLSLQGP